MGRLIDADILIAELQESAFHHCNNPREDSLLQRDRVIVRAQPTVPAVPLDKVKQIKNRLEKMPFYFGTTFHGETIKTVDVDKVIEMLDEAIKEVEHGALFDETNGR